MKYFQGFMIFFFVAIFIALMVLPGDNYYRKKSQRPSISFETYLIIGFVGGCIGLGIAASWEEEEKKKLEAEEERKRIWKIQEEEKLERIRKSETLGVHLLNNTEYKEGRKWIFETTWTNPITNKKNIIKTLHNKEIDFTVTMLNTEILYNHNSNEGSHIFIEKCHLKYKYDIINKIIDGELETT